MTRTCSNEVRRDLPMTNVMTGAVGRPARAGLGLPGYQLLTMRWPAAPGCARGNPLLGLREFQHEYDEPQVEGQMFQQQDNQKK